MKLVFVSGKYSAASQAGVEANSQLCIDLAVAVAAAGAMPIVPNLMTDPRFMQVQGYNFWIEATLDTLARCDAVIFTKDYFQSSGALREETHAMFLNIPAFYNIEALSRWIERSK